MPDLPAHVGRETDAETGYALVCTATPDGNPHTDTLCGKPATHHLRWNAATTENSLTCDGHLGLALNFGPHDVHSVEDSACGMPGSHWVPGRPSHCAMDVLDDEPTLSGAASLTAPCPV
ncbi:hypothetical protein ABZ749_01095 [Micromonospora sp. NPDC047753]|uniref:hypothetical protein n=1 Tax=Micromonospora sp. NPDC047753 TaxID=3154817 RepID=UPI0033CBF7E8